MDLEEDGNDQKINTNPNDKYLSFSAQQNDF